MPDDKTPRLTTAAIDALIASAHAHLAGEEGEGDLADVAFADLRCGVEWLQRQRSKRWAKKVRRQFKGDR